MNKEAKILENATNLFGKLGYKSTTIDMIANKCEMGKGTFYLYYKSKEEVLNAIVKKELKKVKDIADEITKRDIEFNKQISLFLKEIKKIKNDQIFIAKLVKEAKEENNEVVSKYISKLDDYIISELIEKINLAIEKGYIKNCNVEFYAFLIYKTYMLLVLEWESKFNKKIEEQDIYKLIESLFNKEEK